ncbi:copper-binding protein [Jejubacter calystegiae]|uniref:Copper-binding protein n=1 Tax=Jejubacter calystegiae TaxID=2579935 RepID=A0A4V1G7I0_9ENTR|nr:copper-binding protein [Jejubacter calystegiae]QCT19717.1 copper-binding protein [Jejubacter calystegiae]
MLSAMTTLNPSSFQQRRQLKALAFLVLTGIAMMICLTQRAGVLRDLQITAAGVIHAAQIPEDKQPLPAALSPCQLSAHSLFSALPLLFDAIVLLPGLLALLLPVLMARRAPFPHGHEPPWPRRRIHLTNCVFRE